MRSQGNPDGRAAAAIFSGTLPFEDGAQLQLQLRVTTYFPAQGVLPEFHSPSWESRNVFHRKYDWLPWGHQFCRCCLPPRCERAGIVRQPGTSVFPVLKGGLVNTSFLTLGENEVNFMWFYQSDDYGP